MPLLPAAAAIISLVLIAYVATTLVLLRQNGRLLLRVDALENRVGPAPVEAPGLPKNAPAPAFSLPGLDGAKVTLDQLMASGKPVVLLFAGPGCGPCEALFPEVAQWQKEHADRRSIVMISSGSVKENREAATRFGLSNVLVQKDREVAEDYRSAGTPSAVLIRDGVVDTPLAVGADGVRSLIVRASLPPTLKIGEKVPSLKLTGLDGKVTNLSEIRGRNTLLLFWDHANPNCHYMVADLKTRERVRLANVPDLVIVASGSEKDIRALGLASTGLSPGKTRVLLDPHLAGRTIFGAESTPSAVLIDEEGRVASTVGEGYIPSFEMAGLVPFVPSDEATVEGMLKLAGVQATDVVYDLGCGDGRVVIAAAKTYGARGVGVDINPERLAEGRANARKAGVEHLVQFEERALLDADLRGATVVTMYLLPKMNLQLRPKLLAELAPGTRVVSHAFTMDDWTPDRETKVKDDLLYLWTIPSSEVGSSDPTTST